MKEQLQDAHKYQAWHQSLQANGLSIHHIEEKYTRYRRNGEVLFSLVELDASTPEGDKIPPVCFIKGKIVSIMVCLIDDQTGEVYVLMVRQRRICNGDYTYEQVAGMVDGTDDPWDVAQREVEEETGLVIDQSQLVLLNEAPYFTSTGASEEALYFFYCEIEMSLDKIRSYDQQHRGAADEHERIITAVVPLAETRQRLNNTSGLLNLFLYEEQKRKR